MILSITIEDITGKEADDIIEELIVYLRDEMGVLISDYRIDT